MIISIMNHKSGSGRSTSCLNLGKALASRGLSVLLMDISGNAGLSKMAGIREAEMNSATLFQLGDDPVKYIVHIGDLDILPTKAGIAGYVEPANPFLMHFGLKYLFRNYDYVLIDIPSILNNIGLNALVASNSVIIPTCITDRTGMYVKNALATIEDVRRSYNKNLKPLGVLPFACKKSYGPAWEPNDRTMSSQYVFTSKILYDSAMKRSDADENQIVSNQEKTTIAKNFSMLASEVVKRALINV